MNHGEPLDSFLRSLSQQVSTRQRITPLPGPAEIDAGIRQIDAKADLPARFIAAANDSGARTTRTSSENLRGALLDLLRNAGLRSLLITSSLDCLAKSRQQLEAEFALAGIQIRHTHDEQTLFSVDATVTGVVAGIAETGSILVTTGPDVTRGESLYSPVHIALTPRSKIVADLADATALLAVCLPRSSNATLITGPSKTADIEGVLVTGVHGPGVLYIVVIDDQ